MNWLERLFKKKEARVVLPIAQTNKEKLESQKRKNKYKSDHYVGSHVSQDRRDDNIFTDPLNPLNPLSPISPFSVWTHEQSSNIESSHQSSSQDNMIPIDENNSHNHHYGSGSNYDSSSSSDSSSYDSGSSYDSSSSSSNDF